MEEKILESLSIKSKVIGCDCVGWGKSWSQIEAHVKGNTYCPWCGEKTKLVVG